MHNPVITIQVTDAGTRVSRITDHGEEVISASLEVQMIATRLWGQLQGGHLTGYDSLKDRLEKVADSISTARKELVAPLASLEQLVAELKWMHQRLTSIDTTLSKKSVTREDVKAWIEEALKPKPGSVSTLGGQ